MHGQWLRDHLAHRRHVHDHRDPAGKNVYRAANPIPRSFTVSKVAHIHRLPQAAERDVDRIAGRGDRHDELRPAGGADVDDAVGLLGERGPP